MSKKILITFISLFIFALNTYSASLTSKQQQWLASQKEIKIGIQKEWIPLSYEHHGIPKGLGVDYIHLMNKQLEGKLTIVADTFKNNLEKVQNGTLDAMIDITPTKKREPFYLFTTPYADIPHYIVSLKNSNNHFKTIEDLEGKTIAVERGYGIINKLKDKLQHVNFKNYDNTVEAIEGLSSGEADAYIGNRAVVNYILQNNFITNLEFQGKSSISRSVLAFGVAKENKILRDILQTAYDNISTKEKQKIFEEYVGNIYRAHTQLDLTQEEQVWIKEHATIKVGGELDWVPFDFVKEGKYQGISKDIVENIAKKANLRLEYITGPSWKELLEAFKKGEIDLLPAMYHTKKREEFTHFTHAYYEIRDYVFGKEEDNSIASIEDLKGKTVAVIEGYAVVDNLKNKFPNIKLYKVENLQKGIDSVLLGKADVYIDAYPTVMYVLSQSMQTNIKPLIPLDFYTNSLRIGVNKSQPLLASIFNKGLDALTQEEKNNIVKRWFLHVNESAPKIQLNLNEAEKQWLAQQTAVKFSVDPNWLPIEQINPDTKKYEGIMSDILEKITELSGIQFALVPTEKWADSVALIKEKKIDMLAAVSVTDERKKFLNFSDTTIELTDGVIMRTNSPFIASLDDLKGLKIGVSEGTYRHKMLEKTYPELTLVPTRGVKKSLEMLRDGKIDAYIGNLEVLSLMIIKESYFNLKVALRLDTKRALKIAFKKEYPAEALSIINKALEKISDKEKNSIRERWVGLKVEEGLNYELFYKIAIVFIVLILLVFFWNRKLKSIVEKKTSELTILLKAFDKHVIASKTNKKGKITYVSDAFCEISGYKREELIGKSHNIVRHPDMPKTLFKDLWTTIKQGKVWRGDIKNLTKNGEVYWVHTIISPEYDSDNKFVGYSGIRYDITAKKEVEELTQTLELKVEARTKELNEERDFISLIINTSQDAVVAIDKDSKVTLWSSAATKIFGYTKEEMLSHSIDKIIPNEFKQRHHQGMENYLKSGDKKVVGQGSIEIMGQCKNGQLIPIDLTINQFKIHGEIFFNAIIRDNTERKKLVETIQSQRQFNEQLLDSQEQMIITNNGTEITSANKSFLKFFDVQEIEEFKTRYDAVSISDVFNKNAPKGFIQKIMDEQTWLEYILENMGENRTHKVMITRNKIDYVFSVTAAKLPSDEGLMSAVFTNITEMERAKLGIELILANIMLPVIIASKAEAVITYANKYASKLFNIPLDELIGSPATKIYRSDEQKEAIQTQLEEQGYITNLEQSFVARGGEEFIAFMSVKSLIYQNKDSYIGMFVDVTKQKEVEAENQLIHKQTQDSIEYASLIQHTLIPSHELFREYFKDYLAIWRPKDIVGGDIYLFEELRHKNECILMVIDCTGHGVPGAFVTMLVKAIERQIISNIINSDEVVSPAKVLSIFNRSMKHLLKQEDEDSISNAGFDGGVLYYNKDEQILKFAGAETPLFYEYEGEVTIIKGDRHSIGYKKSDANYEFKEHIIEAKEGMQLYLTTDGYLDQNGGKKGFPFGKRNFAKIIEEHHHLSFPDQQEVLLYTMMDYQGNEERNDDIAIVGVKI